MKKISKILAYIGIVLLFLPLFSGVDVFDEQAFRWRLEHWFFAGAFVCFTVAMILRAIRTKSMVMCIVWGLLSLLPLYVVVDTVRLWPRLIYSDSHYQMWANIYYDSEYWKLYYGTGLVIDDVGGTPQSKCRKLDSCYVKLYDELGVIWVETWSTWQGKYFDHEGELIPIDSRYCKGNYMLHTAELDSLLSILINDSVEPGTWYKTRSVID